MRGRGPALASAGVGVASLFVGAAAGLGVLAPGGTPDVVVYAAIGVPALAAIAGGVVAAALGGWAVAVDRFSGWPTAVGALGAAFGAAGGLQGVGWLGFVGLLGLLAPLAWH